MGRIGYFSIRGFWITPLALFAITVVAAVSLGGWPSLGAGLGVGLVYSSIIAFIYSISASRNQSVLEVMHEVDASLQVVDYRFDVWGNSHIKMNSARGEWQIDIPNSRYSRLIIRGPNQLYQVIPTGPEFTAEITEMMKKIGA
jgi:hypothetical protein